MIEHNSDLTAIAQELWDNDIHRLRPGTDYRIALQVIIIIIIKEYFFTVYFFSVFIKINLSPGSLDFILPSSCSYLLTLRSFISGG